MTERDAQIILGMSDREVGLLLSVTPQQGRSRLIAVLDRRDREQAERAAWAERCKVYALENLLGRSLPAKPPKLKTLDVVESRIVA